MGERLHRSRPAQRPHRMDTTILDHSSQLPIPAPLCSPRAPVFLGATVHSIHELPTFLKATPTPLHKKYTPSTETLPRHHIPLMLYNFTHSCTQLFVSSLRAPCPTYRQYPKGTPDLPEQNIFTYLRYNPTDNHISASTSSSTTLAAPPPPASAPLKHRY